VSRLIASSHDGAIDNDNAALQIVHPPRATADDIRADRLTRCFALRGQASAPFERVPSRAQQTDLRRRSVVNAL
jgi:hypothetical protein